MCNSKNYSILYIAIFYWFYFLLKVTGRKTNHCFENLPTIIVETPLGVKVTYVEGTDLENAIQHNPAAEENRELEDNIGDLLENVHRSRANMLRRNSISLPNLEGLELNMLTERENKVICLFCFYLITSFFR